MLRSTELKHKTPEELTGILSELKSKMAKLSFELEANTLKDSSQIGKTKRDIARVLTELSKIQINE